MKLGTLDFLVFLLYTVCTIIKTALSAAPQISLCRRGAGIKHSTVALLSPIECIPQHRLNMEVGLQSLLGLHVTWCAQLYSLAETPQLPPSPPFGLVLRGRYWSAEIDDISL
jgi:hypothetical protein